MRLSPEALVQRLTGAPLALLLDIDGTLCDLVDDPQGARVPAHTHRALVRLASTPGVFVALVTGRAVADARRMVDIPGVAIVGNHGLEHVDRTGQWGAVDGWSDVEPTMRAVATRLTEVARRFPGAELEDKEYSLTMHYRRIVDAGGIPALRRDVIEIVHSAGLRLSEGKRVLDIIPPLDVDKGRAVLQLVREWGADAPGASVLFAGDDVTDEHAFRALAAHVPDAVTIRIAHSEAPTAARFRLESPAELAVVLDHLADRVSTDVTSDTAAAERPA